MILLSSPVSTTTVFVIKLIDGKNSTNYENLFKIQRSPYTPQYTFGILEVRIFFTPSPMKEFEV